MFVFWNTPTNGTQLTISRLYGESFTRSEGSIATLFPTYLLGSQPNLFEMTPVYEVPLNIDSKPSGYPRGAPENVNFTIIAALVTAPMCEHTLFILFFSADTV